MLNLLIFVHRTTNGHNYHLQMRRSTASVFNCVSVCLSVCPVLALTFQSLDPETSFLARSYVFRISRSNFLYQGHWVKVKVTGTTTKGQTGVTKYRHSQAVCLWLKGSLDFTLGFSFNSPVIPCSPERKLGREKLPGNFRYGILPA